MTAAEYIRGMNIALETEQNRHSDHQRRLLPKVVCSYFCGLIPILFGLNSYVHSSDAISRCHLGRDTFLMYSAISVIDIIRMSKLVTTSEHFGLINSVAIKNVPSDWFEMLQHNFAITRPTISEFPR